MLRIIVISTLVPVGLLVLGFSVLVLSSLSYDMSDPRARPNAYYSVESVVIDRPVGEVFRFVQHEIPSVYTRMSPVHEKVELLNAEALVEDAEVDVWDYFDFEPLPDGRTRLVQTVVLDMKSPIVKSVIDIAAFLSGTRGDRERQFEAQLQNLALFVEDSAATRQRPFDP